MQLKIKYVPANAFENLYKVLSSHRFLNKEGLGGELPFFIHSYPISKNDEVERNISSLIKRLKSDNIEVLEINLYNLSMDLLNKKSILDQVLLQEQNMPKQKLLKILAGSLNIDSVVLPEISRLISVNKSRVIFLSGVGSVYPFIRSHTILNNLQSLITDVPLVMFFPGTYNNQTLTLFDILKDDNYYRAHNINEYKI